MTSSEGPQRQLARQASDAADQGLRGWQRHRRPARCRLPHPPAGSKPPGRQRNRCWRYNRLTHQEKNGRGCHKRVKSANNEWTRRPARHRKSRLVIGRLRLDNRLLAGQGLTNPRHLALLGTPAPSSHNQGVS